MFRFRDAFVRNVQYNTWLFLTQWIGQLYFFPQLSCRTSTVSSSEVSICTIAAIVFVAKRPTQFEQTSSGFRCPGSSPYSMLVTPPPPPPLLLHSDFNLLASLRFPFLILLPCVIIWLFYLAVLLPGNSIIHRVCWFRFPGTPIGQFVRYRYRYKDWISCLTHSHDNLKTRIWNKIWKRCWSATYRTPNTARCEDIYQATSQVLSCVIVLAELMRSDPSVLS